MGRLVYFLFVFMPLVACGKALTKDDNGDSKPKPPGDEQAKDKVGDDSVESNEPFVALTQLRPLAAGQENSCVISAGELYCWGWSIEFVPSSGQNIQTTPKRIDPNLSGATAITASEIQACAIFSGSARCWGYNTNGSLGNGSFNEARTPAQVIGLESGVNDIATGLDHACAIVNGSVYCWGTNTYGQLGDGLSTLSGNLSDSCTERPKCNYSATPVQISGITRAKAISAGYGHTCALVQGRVKCWGRNQFGQLGNGLTDSSNVPVDVPGIANVTHLAAGKYYTCAANDTAVYCWGAQWDQTPDNSEPYYAEVSPVFDGNPKAVPGINGKDVTVLSAGPFHACAVANGVASCWGFNQQGELATSSVRKSTEPILAIASGATDVAAGFFHSCAIADGNVTCWKTGHGTLSEAFPITP